MMNYTQVSTGETLARKQVREVLQAHKGTMARMAAQLGVTRTAVWLVLKGKSKSRRILCACVGEAKRLLGEGQGILERREERACPNCGEIGGEPETIRGAGWSEEVCSRCVCVGRGTHAGEMHPAARERDSEPRDGAEEACPF